MRNNKTIRNEACYCWGYYYARVDRFPPKVKDLLASSSRKQGLWYTSQVAVEARVIVLREEEQNIHTMHVLFSALDIYVFVVHNDNTSDVLRPYV